MLHQSFLNMESSITTFGSILAFIPLFVTILHSSRCSGYFSHFCNFFNFPTFLTFPSRALRRVMPSTQLELFPLFHSLCLGDSVFVCIHLCFSRQSCLINRSDSFSTFVVVRFHRSSMRSQRCTTRTTSSVTASLDVTRQHMESSWLRLWNSFHHKPWQWRSRSFFVSCDFRCQLHVKSHHLPRRATQAVPVRRVPCITQCLSRPTFASHNSVHGNAQHCSRSSMMTDQDALSHAACK